MEGKKIIILTAPSGAGKTSITRHLVKTFPELKFSVSAATRAPRANERDGVDYHFMSVEEFQHRIQHNEFVEWEMVYDGKYYGTLTTELEAAWNEDRVPILDIDVKGAIHVQSQYPDTTLSIFIMAPSIEVLKRRLESRGSETAESVETRINKAAFEMSFSHQFKHVIVNDNLAHALSEAEDVVKDFLSK
jgi:guanylate kinase